MGRLTVLPIDEETLLTNLKVGFKIGHFWALLPFHTPGMAQNFCRTQKWSTGLLFVRALPLNAQLVVMQKGPEMHFPKK